MQNNPITVPLSSSVPSVVEVNSTSYQASTTPLSADRPVYQYVQQFANNVGATVALNGSSPSTAIWNLSGDVPWNFARSYLTFQFQATASTNVTAIDVSCIPIDNITLQTTGGTVLGQLSNVAAYSKVMPALTTNFAEYANRGAVIGATTPAGGFYTECDYLQPHGVISSLLSCTGPVAAITASGGAIISTAPMGYYTYGTTASPSVATISAAIPDANSGSTKSIYGRQRMVYAGANGAGVAVQFLARIPFDAFVGSILAVDKDLLFGQNLQLVVNFAACNQFIWDHSALAAANATVIDYTGAVTLNNCYLWMAKEVNGNIVADLRSKKEVGYTVNIPYTFCGKNNTSATGLYAAPQMLSSGMGICLKRILNIVANGTQTRGLINDIDNVNGHKYTTVQTFLDASPLQQKQLSAGTGIEDYQYLKKFLENSAVSDVREFQIDSFFLDNFACSLDSGSDILSNDTVNDGLMLGDSSKNYYANFTLATGGSGANVLQYMTWLRRLYISPSGMLWK